MTQQRCVAAMGALLSLLVVLAAAQPPASKDPPRPDEIKVPADAVLVLYEKAADALRSLPRFVVLSPERYNALMSDLDRLNRQLQARQPIPVTSWKITGKVEGGIARLKVTFGFWTQVERAAVTLGCGRAQPTAILLDDRVPPIWLNNDGLVVEVEKPGEHRAVLDLEMRLQDLTGTGPRPATADATTGFELDLPLTPVTAIDLELPQGVKLVEVNRQPAGQSLKGNRLSGSLGSVSRLRVSWKSPQAVTGPVTLLTSRGRNVVSVAGEQVDTEARLLLQDLGRSARDWHLRVPEGAEVHLANSADRDRLRADLPRSRIPDGRLTIPLAAPSGDPLALTVRVSRPRGTGPIPVGPFAIEGASTMTGTLWVEASGGQRVRCQPYHALRPTFTVAPRALEAPRSGQPEGMDAPPANAIAGFRYSALAVSEKPDVREPWFRLSLDSVQGALDTQVQHSLRLDNGGAREEWRLTTVVDAQPVQSEADHLELDWPAPWRLDRERGLRPRELVAGFREENSPRLVRVDLQNEALKPFRLTLEASAEGESQKLFAPVPECPFASAIIRLPQPQKVLDRGRHEITVQVPRTYDLRVRQPDNPGLELVTQESDRLVWRAERLPKLAQLAIAWKPFRPEVRVNSVVNLSISGKQAEVTHRLHFHFEEKGVTAPAEVLLRVPVALPRFGILEGGRLAEELPAERAGRSGRGTERQIRCLLDPARRGSANESVVVLKYGLALADLVRKDSEEVLQGLLGVPLVSAAEATHGQVRVRVWTDPGVRARPVEAAWEVAPLELVEDHDRLPTLVLGSLRPVQGLTLRLEASADPVSQRPVLLERGLIQVRVGENNFQYHRARFLVRQLTSDRLDLAFAAPLEAIDLQVGLDGVSVGWESLAGPPTETGEAEVRRSYLARLKLPRGPLKKPGMLEVIYQVPPGRSGLVNSVQTVLPAVTIPGLLAGVPIRWQIDLPSNQVPLLVEGADSSWRWGWRGWLPAPRPAVNTGDLERWLWGEGDPRGMLSEDEASLVPAVVSWRGTLGTVTLYHVAQQAWLLFCSLVILVLGVTIGNAALRLGDREQGRGRLFWSLVALLLLAAGVSGLLWPGLMAAFLYGAQPGAAVVLVVLSVQWLVHERYRRRVIFLPGFRRVKNGSSLIRSSRSDKAASSSKAEPMPSLSGSQGGRGNAAGPRREPSTVDAPNEAKPL